MRNMRRDNKWLEKLQEAVGHRAGGLPIGHARAGHHRIRDGGFDGFF